MFGAGYSSGSQSQQSQQSSNTSQSNQYSPGQQSLQDQLTGYLKSLFPSMSSGGLSPGVTAMKTKSADAINRNYSSVGDRVSKFLSARGFGQSGEQGKTALQTELARQGSLADNEANYAGIQQSQNNSSLAESLAAAFQSLGSNVNQTGQASGSGKQSGFSLSGAFAP